MSHDFDLYLDDILLCIRRGRPWDVQEVDVPDESGA